MELTKEQVQHIADLARLKLSPEEVEKFSHELTDILNWVEMLGEVDTDGVKETSQVTGLQNVLRADKVEECSLVDGKKQECRDALLDCTELPVERKQIKVKPVL